MSSMPEAGQRGMVKMVWWWRGEGSSEPRHFGLLKIHIISDTWCTLSDASKVDSQPVSFFGSRHEIKGHEPTKDWSNWLWIWQDPPKVIPHLVFRCPQRRKKSAQIDILKSEYFSILRWLRPTCFFMITWKDLSPLNPMADNMSIRHSFSFTTLSLPHPSVKWSPETTGSFWW